MGKQKGDQVQVVASHQALNVVAGWLGVSAEAALEEDAQEEQQPPPRTPFLGLGAKYLPHHKVVGFAATLDNKLKQRIEASKKRKAAQAKDEDDDSKSGGSPGTGLGSSGKGFGRHQTGGSRGADTSNAGDSEDEDDVGKSSAFKKKHHSHGNGLGSVNGHSSAVGQPALPSSTTCKQGAGSGSGQQPVGPLPGSRAAREALLLGTGQGTPGLQPQSGGKKKKKKKNKGQPADT